MVIWKLQNLQIELKLSYLIWAYRNYRIYELNCNFISLFQCKLQNLRIKLKLYFTVSMEITEFTNQIETLFHYFNGNYRIYELILKLFSSCHCQKVIQK